MKKVISLFMSVAMLVNIFCSGLFNVYAQTGGKTQSDAVAWAKSKIGSSIDYDGVYGAQCVDLTKAYYKYLGNSPVSGNGCDYARNSLPSGWSRIRYYSGFVPQPGDVAVWTYASSAYGHVAIVSSANSASMNVVEQNGSTHITREHTYRYNYGKLFGFIRPDFVNSYNPQGKLEVVKSSVGNLYIKGWTFDKDNLNSSLTVRVYIGGSAGIGEGHYISADKYRSDINNTYNCGSYHGFEDNISTSKTGNQTVYVYANNINGGSDVLLGTANITIPVQKYTIKYSVSNGSNAPASQTFQAGESITIPSSSPTSSEILTVSFNGNGGCVSPYKQNYKPQFAYWKDSSGNKYSPGETVKFLSDKTLYAVFDYPYLDVDDATKENSYFAGWYDSNDTDEFGVPIGNKYTQNSKIDKDLTLYAMWTENKNVLFGDITRNGETTVSDVSLIYRKAKGTSPVSGLDYFLGDLNCDGKITTDDSDLLYSYIRKQISYSDLPAVKYFSGISLYSITKTNYNYGESFDYDGIVLCAKYFNSNIIHKIDSDYIVSGYNPYKVGSQLVNIKLYQYSTSVIVNVIKPEINVNLDTNGGYLDDNSVIYQKYGEKYSNLPVPTKEGYTFVNWLNTNNGEYITNDDICYENKNITLVAQWERNINRISFENSDKVYYYDDGRQITLPTLDAINSELSKEYELIGWKIDGENGETLKPGDIFVVYGNITFVPLLERKEQNHTYSSWKYNNDAVYNSKTDYTDGTATRTCSKCGTSETKTIDGTGLLRANSASVVLDASVTMNIGIDKSRTSPFESKFIRVEFGGESYDLYDPSSSSTESRTYFDFDKISPDKFADVVTITPYGITSDGIECKGHSVTYSIKDYCYSQLGKATNQNLRSLLVELLYYGEAYQKYRDYNKDNLVTSDLTASQRNLHTTDDLGYKNVTNSKYQINPNGTAKNEVNFKSASMLLEGKVIPRIKVEISSSKSISDYTFRWTVDGQNTEFSYDEHPDWFTQTNASASDKRAYYVDCTILKATQFSTPFYLTVFKNKSQVSNVLQYSVESYATGSTVKNNAKLKVLVDQMLRYGRAEKVRLGK
ncbi:MAG: InlB B-repeat-containing protein [Erysipelotrichia bacterium]|nr:InlB B-repeat-containing protein [Erysipelotrichia bacterium]